ncbi:MAG: tRNA (adenosine(37)-N6)-threonylcarbamoyltransferase complex dimerization subunit type 1 TsaB [Porticoccaceae bacterium]
MAALLTIETSTPACSVALKMQGRLISRYSEVPRSHTQQVMPMINEVLNEAEIKIDQVDAIGVTVGPGSFTGLRIGFASAQGLAFAAGLPVIAISSLQAIVATYERIANVATNSIVLPLLDARMDEFNCAVYQLQSGPEMQVLAPDQLLSTDDTIAMIDDYPSAILVGDAGTLATTHELTGRTYKPIYPNALDLIPITESRLAEGIAKPIGAVDLVYLRGAEAWKKRKRLRDI